MGVHLTPVVVRHATTLEALRGRTIAVDGNLELYQFLSIVRLRDGSPLRDSHGRITSHLSGLLFRTSRLLSEFDIREVFVFDGPPPDLKREEVRRRREARERSQREYESAVASGNHATAWSKAVMTSRLTREMVEDAKTLLTRLGIPWVQAPSEGEATAAGLARGGAAWAVGGKDYDSLLFGAPRLARFVALGSREFLPSRGISRAVPPEVIELDPWLERLGLSREQLIDAAILIGTDFNAGVPGIGPKTAVRLMRDYRSLPALPADIRTSLPENVDSIREFFLFPPVARPDEIEPGAFDSESVLTFLSDERGFSRPRVESVLEKLREHGMGRPRLDDFLDPLETVK